MVLVPPQSRPSGGTLLGNHEARIRALERLLLLAGGWRFNFDNEGGYGYVQFNDSFDLDLKPDPLAVGGTWGAAFEDATGEGLLLGSDGGEVLIKARGAGVISLDSETSPLRLLVNGQPYEFRDDGTIHVPTGGGVVADL